MLDKYEEVKGGFNKEKVNKMVYDDESFYDVKGKEVLNEYRNYKGPNSVNGIPDLIW